MRDRVMAGVIVNCTFWTCCLWAPQDRDLATLLRELDHEKGPRRYSAARDLGRLGPAAADAIEPLVARIGDHGYPEAGIGFHYAGPFVFDAVSDALIRIGPGCVPGLIEELEGGDPARQRVAARTLGGLGKAAQPAFDALSDVIRQRHHFVTGTAIQAIAQLELPPKQVMPVLRTAAADDEYFIRCSALDAMYHADPKGTLAIPLLRNALADDDTAVVSAAALTLARYGERAAPAVHDLYVHMWSNKTRPIGYLHFSQDVPLRNDILRAMCRIGPTAKMAVPAATRMMKTAKQGTTRVWAAAAIVRIKPGSEAAETAFRHLRTVAGIDHTAAQEQAISAIGILRSPEAIHFLIALLEGPDETEYGCRREAAALALGDIGPAAAQAVPALQAALKARTEDPEDDEQFYSVRMAAMEALGKIGPAASDAVPDLKKLVWSTDYTLADAAVTALVGIGRDGSR